MSSKVKKCKPGFEWYAGACRSLESIAKKKQKDLERSRERYKNKEYADAKNALKKKRYRENLEAEQKKSRERYYENREEHCRKRIARAKLHRERELANRRARYASDPEKYARREREKRDRRNPDRIIRRAIKEFTEGSIDLDEFSKRVGEAVERCDSMLSKPV